MTMNKKQLLPTIFLYEGKPVKGFKNHEAPCDCEDAVQLASYYSNCGADGIVVLDLESETDSAHEQNIDCMKEIIRNCDVPVYAGGVFKRFEDTKKYLYTGARQAVIYVNGQTSEKELNECEARFGKEKLMLCADDLSVFTESNSTFFSNISSQILVLHFDVDKDMEILCKTDIFSNTEFHVIPYLKEISSQDLMNVLKSEKIMGITGNWVQEKDSDLMAFKYACKADKIPVMLLESRLSWSDFKLNSDGMVPVIVQDYKTDEVLMMAYMNQEAFEETIASGVMTYWSRSRKELWKKGLTSGHFQYLKELHADCDYDTILAKVFQVGAACHTGKRSCFFNEITKKDYQNTNPLKVFEDVFATIMDRKVNPKEGSYTNYLFDKGIDKILKKVGEEATEIVIAAKNPNPEEIKYEISDFLYHVMVLMAERGVTWEDITRELAQR